MSSITLSPFDLITLEGSNHIFNSSKSKFTIPRSLFAQVDVVSYVILDKNAHVVYSDNAAMIAWASMERFLSGDTDPYDIDLRPKWSLEDLRKPDEEILLGQ